MTYLGDNDEHLLSILNTVKKGGEVSRHYKMQLVKRGYLEIVPYKRVPGRGRPAFQFNLTAKGQKATVISKQWEKIVEIRKRIEELYEEMSKELISDFGAADEMPKFDNEAHRQ